MSHRLLFSAFFAQIIKLSLASLLLLGIGFMHGCSTVEDTAQAPIPKRVEIVTPELQAETPSISQQQQLEIDIKAAQLAQNWVKWLRLAEMLWTQVSPDQQMAIEYQIYQTLKNLTPEQLATLQMQAQDANNLSLRDWLALVDTQKQPAVWRQNSYENLALFHETAIYHHHLIPLLQDSLTRSINPTQVAVFLPFKGPYAKVSEQIRNGIIKYQMAKAPQIGLAFYDSSNLDTLEKNALQALNDGAQRVIGPLTKESIAELAHRLTPEQASHFWALNNVNNTPFKQMPFGSTSEALQIVQQLQYNGYKSISLLSSDASSDSKLAEQIQQLWLDLDEHHQVTLKQFSQKRPNLRKALGDAINESQSQSRLNNLNWLLKEKLEFTPRPRQDLDALVVLADSQTLAVFKPQMKFFELSLPIFASSKLTPIHFSDTPPLKDLQGVRFPTMSIALKPNPSENTVQTPFEAFGWDSLFVLVNQQKFAPHLCLNQGTTGRLSFDDQEQRLDRQLIWATYNAKGQLVAMPSPEAVYPVEIPAEIPQTNAPVMPERPLQKSIEPSAANHRVQVLPITDRAKF